MKVIRNCLYSFHSGCLSGSLWAVRMKGLYQPKALQLEGGMQELRASLSRATVGLPIGAPTSPRLKIRTEETGVDCVASPSQKIMKAEEKRAR